MKKYEVIKPLKLGKGAILDLSETQAETRKTILQKVGEFYEAQAETQWIAGEVIGLEGEQPPAMLAYLKDLEPDVVEYAPDPLKTKTGRPRK
jgi:hypothetical protein